VRNDVLGEQLDLTDLFVPASAYVTCRMRSTVHSAGGSSVGGSIGLLGILGSSKRLSEAAEVASLTDFCAVS
jgi:hypothetical protein